MPVSAASASNSPQQVSVTFIVTSASAVPTLALTATSIALTAAQGGAGPAPQVINALNAGGGALGALSLGSVAYSAGATGWLVATIAGSSAPAAITLAPSSSGLAVAARWLPGSGDRY